MIAATCGTLTNRVARPRSGISLARFLLGLVIYEETLSNSIMLARAVVLSASRVSALIHARSACAGILLRQLPRELNYFLNSY
jgi:hypothetical protein